MSALQSTETLDTKLNADEAQLAQFGYKQTLHRTWGQFESFMSAFGSLYVVGGVRILFSIGINAGGPAALWSSMLITAVLLTITAASLAEICSSIPLSIYIWATYAAGGPGSRYGRLFGFIVAFWAVTAWTSFVASNNQATANFILTELNVFDLYFPDGVDNSSVKFRAVVWAMSEGFLFFAILTNLFSPAGYSWIFRASFAIIFIDLFATVIYLPIGVSQTYGFQSASFVFTSTYNGIGASDSIAWVLSFLSTSGILTGFDAAGHVAEETKDASLVAARGIFWSAVATSLIAFPLLILFLFCSPDLETLTSIAAPQPFVIIYQLAFGSAGQIVMTTIAVIGLFINTSIAIVAASRLVYAVARDGILPGSAWIGRVSADGQPRNAVIFIGIVSSILLCAILPSSVAFTSLVSAGAVPTIAAYGLIPLLRLIFTRGDFANARWSNGRFSVLFCAIAAVFNTFLLAVLLSPYIYPVTPQTFNFASVIFGAVTIAGIVAWFLVPEEKWLNRRHALAGQEEDVKTE